MQTSLAFDPVPRRAPSRERPITVNLRCPPVDVHVPLHQHEWAQLVYPLRGGIRVSAAGMVWHVPALRAVWIPPHVDHDVKMLGAVELRTIYIAPEVAPLSLQRCSVLEVSELLRALFESLSDVDREMNESGLRWRQITDLLLTEIALAPPLSLGLPMPQDRRLQTLCQALADSPACNWSLADWAARVGASERTLARLFQQELGCSFAAWRQQLRLSLALDWIERGVALGEVAERLGYAGQAAFGAMFRRAFGVPPSRFSLATRSLRGKSPDSATERKLGYDSPNSQEEVAHEYNAADRS